MKKNYLSPIALVIDTLTEEFCEESISSGVVIDSTYEGGYVGGNTDDILDEEW